MRHILNLIHFKKMLRVNCFVHQQHQILNKCQIVNVMGNLFFQVLCRYKFSYEIRNLLILVWVLHIYIKRCQKLIILKMVDSKQLHQVLCLKRIIKKDNNQMNQVKKLNKWKINDESIIYLFKICSSIWKELFLKIKQVKLITIN